MGVSYLTNKQIKDRRVLVVDENGKNLGPMDTNLAYKLALEKKLDLVLFVPNNKANNKLAICKIIDYGKFAYLQNRKTKKAKKNQAIIKVKIVKIKPQIGISDLQWKSRQVNNWLKDNYQIKLKMITYGRIATKKELIDQTYQNFLKLIEEYGKVSTELKQVSPIMYEATIVKK